MKCICGFFRKFTAEDTSLVILCNIVEGNMAGRQRLNVECNGGMAE